MFKKLLFLFSKKPTPVVVIVGPASSGKSALAVEVAKKLRGEVISADSRQVYQGLPTFSGAFSKEEMQGVPHHLIGFVKPGVTYSAKDFEVDALREIDCIAAKGKLPIVAGGTAFWAEGLLYERSYAEVPINEPLRKTLERKSNKELLAYIAKKDPRRAKTIDPDNRRRLIRSVEIIKSLGAIPRMDKKQRKGYAFLLVYLDPEQEYLREKVAERFKKRRDGLLEEARMLQDDLTCGQFNELGQSYKNICDLWSGAISIDEFTEKGINEEVRYPKKQRTYINKMYKNYSGPKVHIPVTDDTGHLENVANICKKFFDKYTG